jgi:hypothetical protein
MPTSAPASAGIDYRGWKDCRELRNLDTRVVIVPGVGARVAEFAWRGRNVLLVDPNANGKVLRPGETWLPWDGSQPDTISPAGGSQLAHIWMGQYEVTEATGRSLKCRSQDNATAGLREEKEFALDAREPVLTIRRRLTNISDRPARWAFWERTLLPAGAVGVACVNPRTAFPPAGWARNVKGTYQLGEPNDGNPRVTDGVLMVCTKGKGAGLALDTHIGRTGAIIGKLLFRVDFPIREGKEYPWGKGLNCAFYYAADRLEVEPVSPYYDLKPGESAEWTVTWRLQDFAPATGADEATTARKARAMLEADSQKVP